ncbi:MAG: DUF1467 family protein [Methylobacteriaceae bacterium]|nr:DUF1467 family protein [Methylobacteriaceae bacterium]
MTKLVDWAAGSFWRTAAVVVLLSIVAVAIGRAFALSLAGSIGLYFVVWWTLLFAILPVRIRSQAEIGQVADGTDPGAPASPALRERAIWTTLVSALVFAGVAAFFPLAGL